MLSLLDITSSKGFAQRWRSLKVGEGQAEWGSGRWEGVELPCWGCCLLNPEALQAGKWLGVGEEEQGLSFSLAQPVKFLLFP